MELILGLRVQLLGQLRAIGLSLTPSAPLSLCLLTLKDKQQLAWTDCGDVKDVSLSAERGKDFNITRTKTSPVVLTELKIDLID